MGALGGAGAVGTRYWLPSAVELTSVHQSCRARVQRGLAQAWLSVLHAAVTTGMPFSACICPTSLVNGVSRSSTEGKVKAERPFFS